MTENTWNWRRLASFGVDYIDFILFLLSSLGFLRIFGIKNIYIFFSFSFSIAQQVFEYL
jgi:hypothetical protein